MSNTFFPIKLMEIHLAITKCSKHFPIQNCMITPPDDNRIRYVMCSPNVRNAAIRLIDEFPYNIRIRLVMPQKCDLINVDKMAAVEVYVNKDLQYSCKLMEAPIELALALEVEILTNIMREYHCNINTM